MVRYTLLILAASVSLAADTPQDTALEREIRRLAIPKKLMPEGKRPLFLVRADGVQIYVTKLVGGKLEWVFDQPQATLREYRTGAEYGTHSKGPIWVDKKESTLARLAESKTESEPAPNAEAIDWLLLEVRANGGTFAPVTHVQRVDTWAGLKPIANPTKEGEIIKVPYQATYIFWGD